MINCDNRSNKSPSEIRSIVSILNRFCLRFSECCIFGKQVTECTQECDHLKEVKIIIQKFSVSIDSLQGIEKLNAEKRDLNNELRALRDENMNYYHEIMILVSPID